MHFLCRELASNSRSYIFWQQRTNRFSCLTRQPRSETRIGQGGRYEMRVWNASLPKAAAPCSQKRSTAGGGASWARHFCSPTSRRFPDSLGEGSCAYDSISREVLPPGQTEAIQCHSPVQSSPPRAYPEEVGLIVFSGVSARSGLRHSEPARSLPCAYCFGNRKRA